MIPRTPIGITHSELIAERRAGRSVENEVADVDEASDRGEDARAQGREPCSRAVAQPGQPPFDRWRQHHGRTGCPGGAAGPPPALQRPSPSLEPSARSTGEQAASPGRPPGSKTGSRAPRPAHACSCSSSSPAATLCASRAPSHATESIVAASLVSAWRSTVPPLQPATMTTETTRTMTREKRGSMLPRGRAGGQLGTRELQPQTLRYRGCQAGTLSRRR